MWRMLLLGTLVMYVRNRSNLFYKLFSILHLLSYKYYKIGNIFFKDINLILIKQIIFYINHSVFSLTHHNWSAQRGIMWHIILILTFIIEYELNWIWMWSVKVELLLCIILLPGNRPRKNCYVCNLIYIKYASIYVTPRNKV